MIQLTKKNGQLNLDKTIKGDYNLCCFIMLSTSSQMIFFWNYMSLNSSGANQPDNVVSNSSLNYRARETSSNIGKDQ